MDAQTAIAHLQHAMGIDIDLTHVLMGFALLMTRLLPVVIFTHF